ncbi:MAG: type IV pilus twitching motility protein PilT [Candidatus Ratteibacteria bacterium]|jgi:twitching motility protein PilT
MMKINELLTLAAEKNASDLHLSPNIAPCLRVDGELVFTETTALNAESCKDLCYSILTEEQKTRFENFKELDFSYGIPGVGRFRVNYYYQRGSISGAFRLILTETPNFQELGLPIPVMQKFCSLSRGFILATGATGSGKSTTLAAMINQINENRKCHIITVEDPIEYLFKHKKSIVNQRELGGDTLSFSEALKHMLREDPDVVLVGEMRDLETVSSALKLAETGHLVLSTLHCGEAVESINRIIDIFPTNQQQQTRVQLSLTLYGVISQQLLPRMDGKGRVLATEVMVVTPAIRNLIRENKPQEIVSHLQMGLNLGMETMNRSLLRLYRKKEISLETAINASSNPKELEELINRKT